MNKYAYWTLHQWLQGSMKSLNLPSLGDCHMTVSFSIKANKSNIHGNIPLDIPIH